MATPIRRLSLFHHIINNEKKLLFIMCKHFCFIQSIWWNFLGQIHANEIASETLYKWRGIARLLIFTNIFFSTVFSLKYIFFFYCCCSHAKQTCCHTAIFSVFINNFYSWQKHRKRWVRRAPSYRIARRLKKSRSIWEIRITITFSLLIALKVINAQNMNACGVRAYMYRVQMHRVVGNV